MLEVLWHTHADRGLPHITCYSNVAMVSVQREKYFILCRVTDIYSALCRLVFCAAESVQPLDQLK